MTEPAAATPTRSIAPPHAAEASPRAAGATAFDAALLATLTGAAPDQNTSDRAARTANAQHVRDVGRAARDALGPDIRGVAESEEIGVLRMATITELATAELRGEGQPPAEPAPPKARSRAPGGDTPSPKGGARTDAPDGRPNAPTERRAPSDASRPQRSSTPTQTPAPAPQAGARVVGADNQVARGAQQATAITSASTGAPSAVRVAATPIRAGATPSQPSAIGAAGRARPTIQAGARTAATPQRPHVLRHAKAFQTQLARGLAAALKKGDGLVTLRLRPASLGRLTIDLRVRESQVTARIRATTDAARGLLESGAGELRETLAARGLHLHRLDVQLAEPTTSHPQAQHDAPSNEHHRGHDGDTREGARADAGRSQDHDTTDDALPDDLPAHATLALGVDVVV